MSKACFQRCAELISTATGLLVTAGAGMGVGSGLSDFRGNEGLWNHYPALGKQKKSFSDIASPATFHKNPKLAWGFYGHRLNLYRKTIPHQGFEVSNASSRETWARPWAYRSSKNYLQVKLDWHEYSRANAEELAQFACQGCADFSFTCQDCRQVALWHNG